MYIICDHKLNWIHQREFQDPKMEVPNTSRARQFVNVSNIFEGNSRMGFVNIHFR